MLGHPELPPGLIEKCLDVLKEIMPSERDLIRVIVEIVVELRDGEEEEANTPAVILFFILLGIFIDWAYVCRVMTTNRM